jgi:hypothetical protein
MADHKGGESEPRLRKVWTPEDAARVKMSNEERKDLNRRNRKAKKMENRVRYLEDMAHPPIFTHAGHTIALLQHFALLIERNRETLHCSVLARLQVFRTT